ncbi:type II secretion system minor pseudopilin GspK [Thiomicrorhabdus heinhorstiae]|uniref:Type II secretion system protein K n=1 Tax=Thiomicrorhabdus heinhorstiae TaxID=2748010 RepID=A0ABS0BVW5_9GAMM|nr:type II secretion system minor pseudopilin GspK [Thiomicrorhabdus heinhorstiae]MBF6057971.1 type II secretion system minor pseudopilin GspK [Thiomicrorhabdus heinhorstiae]
MSYRDFAASRLKAKQNGFALITVLLVVALVAILSSELLYRQFADLKRSAQRLHQTQSLAVVWGLESWVKQGLMADLQDNKVDHLQEMWASPMPPIPFEGGTLSGGLSDLQGRLNLNNLLESDEDKRKLWSDITTRYAQQMGLNDGFVDQLRDWIDSDDEPMPYGAESDRYLLKNPAYSAANRAMVFLKEVRNLESWKPLKPEMWLQFQRSACVLPAVTAINVNTAEPRVLLALADWMTSTIVQNWVNKRQVEPAESNGDFRSFMQQETGFSEEEILQALPDWLIDVQSQFFLLQAQVNYGESSQGVEEIFYRQDKNTVVLLQRWLSVTD